MKVIIGSSTVYIGGWKWFKDMAMVEVIDNSQIRLVNRRCHWLRPDYVEAKPHKRSTLLDNVKVMTVEGIEIKADPGTPILLLGSLWLKDGFTVTLDLPKSNGRVGRAFGADLLETVVGCLGWKVERVGVNTVEVNRKLVDVRVSRMKPYSRDGRLAFQFHLPQRVGEYDDPDLVALVCLDGNMPHWFFLPFTMVSELVRITITVPLRGAYEGKWADYENRWDLLQPGGVGEE